MFSSFEPKDTKKCDERYILYKANTPTHPCKRGKMQKINELKLFTFAIFAFHSFLGSVSFGVSDDRRVFLSQLSHLFSPFPLKCMSKHFPVHETKCVRTKLVCKVMTKMAKPARNPTCKEEKRMKRLAY